MKPRTPLVVGNWKMNGDLVANETLYAALRAGVDRSLLGACDAAICPPYPYLGQAATWLGDTGIAWGAQNVAAWDNGAYTGEVSAAMLADLGCKWAIVGHSERRRYHHETNEMVGEKAKRAIEAGLRPILCVGEDLEVREQGAHVAEALVVDQVVEALGPNPGALDAGLVIAYEPVWAIGTGRSASGADAAAMAAAIRQAFQRVPDAGSGADVPILYGGSVTAANIDQFLAEPEIDGALVGGASLKPDEMAGIVARAALTAAARGLVAG